MEVFDYVIVGGGSAGCALASRLSEDANTTVCLIEAGGASQGIMTRMPLGAVAYVPAHFGVKVNNWAFQTVPQPGLNRRRGYQPRGKGLGGSSALNAMVYIRGNRKDYDNWAAQGCDGWSYKDVLPFFQKSENFAKGSDEHHGAEGPLHVTNLPSPHQVSEDFILSGQAMQLPRNTDFNGPGQFGVGHYHVTQFHDHRRGQRCSAAGAYLGAQVQKRPNLDIKLRTNVQRVVTQGGRAVGVEVTGATGISTIRCRREVILSAGAFQSPQLLMLSGIGPAPHLGEHGIPVVLHSPNVGLNLQDHIDMTLSYKVKERDVIGIGFAGMLRLLKGVNQWRKDGSGPLSTNFAEAGGFLCVGDKAQEWPDTQLHFVVARVEDHARRLHLGYGVSCHVCVLRPHSRGSVRLAAGHAGATPLIDPGFLTDDRDLGLLTRAVRETHAIMSAPPLGESITKSHTLTGIESDAELEDVIRNNADTVYHPVGTCRMGADQDSVVDTQLRVRGIDGLRVCDASIMPQIISGNTNAATIMIAEKLASMIRST